MHSKCSRENCSLQKLWANRLHMEILTRNWGKLRPECLKEDGPFTVTSSRYRCRSLKCDFLKTTDLGIWLLNENACLLISSIQICVCFYPTSLQRKFWKYKLMKALQKETIHLSLSLSTHSFFKLIFGKNGHLRSKILQKTTSCGLLDFCISPWPICMDSLSG